MGCLQKEPQDAVVGDTDAARARPEPLHTLSIWCPEGKGSTASVSLDGHNLGDIAGKVTLEITRDRALLLLEINTKTVRIEAEGLVDALKEREPEPGAEKLALALFNATTWERRARDSRDAAERTMASIADQRDQLENGIRGALAELGKPGERTPEAVGNAAVILKTALLREKRRTNLESQPPPSGPSILDSDKPEPD
jgi:hypothetical protein